MLFEKHYIYNQKLNQIVLVLNEFNNTDHFKYCVEKLSQMDNTGIISAIKTDYTAIVLQVSVGNLILAS